MRLLQFMSLSPLHSKHFLDIALMCSFVMVKLLAWLPIIGFKETVLQPSCPSFIMTGNQITKVSEIDGANWQRLKCLGDREGAPSLRYL